jgi:two-component system, NarL family, sensor histidine kinase UhpB
LNLITHIAARSSRRASVRTCLAAIVVAIVVPTLLIAWWLASLSAASVREQHEENILQKASEISAFVDREIANAQHVLVALAGSPYLQSRGLEAFYRQASQVARQLATQIVLHDIRSDEQLVNTAVSWGESLSRGFPAPSPGAGESSSRPEGQMVSDVFWGPIVARHLVAVSMPIVVDDAPVYLLSVGIWAERFAEIIAKAQADAGHLVAIIDRQGAVIARSDRHREFVGKMLPANSDRLLGPSQRISKSTDLEGIPFLWGNVRSDLSGWTVSVGLPDSTLDADARLVLARFAGVGSGVLLIAIVGAYALGGRVTRSIGVLGIDRAPTREEFRTLFESAPNGVVVVDDAGQIVLVNAQMESQFGYSREELVGQPVEALLPERIRGEHTRFRMAFARSPQTRPMGNGRDLLGRRKDGSEFPIEIGLNPIRTTAGNLVMATVVDITARQRAAERLAAALAERDDFRRRSIQAQEDERLRLAHELHDQTGQSLAAVMLELKSIETLVDERDRGRFRLLRLRLEQMGQTLHQVAWQLRPASIDELGLASALGNYISEWSRQYGIDADFHCGADLEALPDDVRTTIYRVVQEGLTNVARHAREATSVSVVIDRAASTMRLTIDDNGCGFDTAKSNNSTSDSSTGGRGGLGLAGMRERLSFVGGELEIESSMDIGTTIFARIPLERERTAA